MSNVQLVKTEKKTKVIFYLSFVGSVILIILLFGGYGRKNNTDNTFQLENPLLKDIKIKNGSSIQIDSYKISLEDGVYEENTQLGHLIFKVTNSKGPVEAEITSSNQLSGGSFGRDGRFAISIMGTHSRTISAKHEGDMLYISYKFEAKDYFYYNLNNSICLTDYKMPSENQELGKEYYFSLDTIEQSKQIQMGKDGIIYISSLGFLVVSERKYTIDDMKIVLTDGSEKNIIDKKNYSVELGSWTTEEKSLFGFNSFFDEFIDSSKINMLIYNGNSYMVSS